MKKPFPSLKFLFTLLMVASVAAIGVGVYLGIVLGAPMEGKLRLLPAVGFVLWSVAWGEFFALCVRLRRGKSAFTPAVGNALSVIGGCMACLAIISLVSALVAGSRAEGFLLIERVLLPCFFLAVAVVAEILRGLLRHAMAIEKEQEGVV